MSEYIYYDALIVYAIPVFIVMIFVEAAIILKTRKKDEYPIKDAIASISMGVGSAILNTAFKSLVVLIFYQIYQYRIFDLGNQWWVWVLLFFADDLSFYAHHRACHEIRLFWAGHVNHHSSTNYNLAIALRQSWGELFHKYIWWLWLPLVGFHPIQILAMMSVSLIYQYFLHTEVVNKLGVLEWVFNTPSHHRVHHASNVRYLDRNHAGILIIWDRIFGTFEPEREEEKVVYGITKNIETYNPLIIATHEYKALWQDVKKAPGFIIKLKYILMPPGWSHDGSTHTAKEMRKLLGEIKTV